MLRRTLSFSMRAKLEKREIRDSFIMGLSRLVSITRYASEFVSIARALEGSPILRQAEVYGVRTDVLVLKPQAVLKGQKKQRRYR